MSGQIFFSNIQNNNEEQREQTQNKSFINCMDHLCIRSCFTRNFFTHVHVLYNGIKKKSPGGTKADILQPM